MHYVYVIQDESGGFYLGCTSDLRQRLIDHNNGRNKSTKGRTWNIVYYEAYVTVKAARQREYRLKHGGRSKQLLFERIRNSLQ